MVTTMGFSDLLGDVDLDTNYNLLSSETKQQIEAEVRRLVDESRQRVTALLKTRRKELEIIADALVGYEVLDLEEIKQVLRGEKLDKMSTGEGVPIKLPEFKYPPSSDNLGDMGSDTRPGGTPVTFPRSEKV